MAYSGKNIVKNSVTLNEVTKTNAEALPNRSGKLLNVDGELFKDNGTNLDKIVTHDAKSSNWGLIATTRRTVADWATTGTGSVSKNSTLQGEPNVDSFKVDLTGAADSASITVEAPNSAVDARSNLVTINYLLFDQTEPVKATFLDWNGNQVGVVDLPVTGSGAASSENLRWKYISTDLMLPSFHGNFDNEIEVVFTSASGITTGSFYINNIQFDSNAGVSGEFVDTQSVKLYGGSGYGSTDTTVAEFTGANANSENDIFKVVSNSVNGTVVEVLQEAYFNLEARGTGQPSNSYYGFTFNSTQLTALFNAVDADKRRGGSWNNSGTTAVDTTNWSGTVEAGTFIRLQGHTSLTIDSNSYFEITAMKNHQGVVKEGKLEGVKEYTPITQGFGTITGVNCFYSLSKSGILSIFGEFTAGTVVASEAQIGLPSGFTVKGSANTMVAGVFGKSGAGSESGGTVIVTNGDAFLNLSDDGVWSTTAVSALNKAVASDIVGSSERLSFRADVPVNEIDLKTELLIPNHVTRLNGQEYPVMGEYVELADGTRYRVYERAYVGALGDVLTGLPLTLVPIDYTKIASLGTYNKLLGFTSTSSYFISTYDTADGTLNISRAGSLLPDGSTYTFRYYDTARPL